jgi:quercetin dioxygenase-like cupin family protein
MIIKTRNQIPAEEIVKLYGVKKELAIGPYDGSDQIVLRILSLEPDRFMPVNAHDFPHIWKIEQGSGILTDGAGTEHQVTAGRFIFIPGNEPYGMRNNGDDKWGYLCFGTADSEKAVPPKASIAKE